MATNRMAYDVLQTTMARQRVTVYDLYGLLGISPNASDAQVRDAYELIIKNAHPNIPSNVVSHPWAPIHISLHSSRTTWNSS